LADEVMAEEPTGFSALALALKQIRGHFDVVSASVWRQADEGRVRLTASSLKDGSVVLAPVTVRFSEEDLLELDAAGHLVMVPSTLGTNFPAVFPDTARTLLVRLGEPSEAVGFATVTTTTPRSWSAGEIDEFKSVTRMLRNLAVRLWVERQSSRREAMLEMANRVSSVATGASWTTAHESRARILSIAREFFDATSAGLWVRNDAEFRLEVRVDDDGIAAGQDESFAVTTDQLKVLSRDGYAVAHVGSLAANHPARFRPDVVALTAAFEARGETSSVLSLVRKDGRRWSDEEIAGARTVAGVIGQMALRLEAEHQVHERLNLEAIVSDVASDMADVSIANIDQKLERILALLVDFFDLEIASLWRFEGDRSICRMAIDQGGHNDMEGVSAPSLDPVLFESRSWLFLPVRDFSTFAGLPNLDDSDSHALVCGFTGPEGMLGSLALIDRRKRTWTDDEIKAATSVATLMGSIRLRMIDARRRIRRRHGDEILISMSQTLLRLNSVDALGAIDGSLEHLRAHLGLSSVAVWERGDALNVFDCPCEATESGHPLVADLVDLSHDDEVLKRLRETRGPIQWISPDSDGVPADLRGLVAMPILLDREEAVFLSALPGRGPLDEDALAVLGTACEILAQLRRRFAAEKLADLRRRAENVVNRILLRFLHTSPGDETDPISEAFSEVGMLLQARSLELWEKNRSGTRASRTEVWRSDPSVRLPADGLESVSLHHPDVGAVTSLTGASEVELVGNLPGRTRVGSPLIMSGEVIGGLLLDIDSPVITDPELDVIKGVLDSFAALIAQLRSRVGAESMLVRKLEADRRLQSLAAQLVRTRSDDVEASRSAFGTLCDPADADHASLWRIVATGDLVEASLASEASAGEVSPIPADHAHITVPRLGLGATTKDNSLVGQWSIESAPPSVKRMFDAIAEPGPRQVLLVGQPVDESQSMYLVVSRPGDQLFDQVDIDFFGSAISMLAEHDSRVTAEQWFTTAIAFAPVAISMRDSEMRLISCNPAYEKLTGRSIDEMRGLDLHHVMSETDAIAHQIRQEESPTEDHLTDEIRYVRPDGGTSWGRITSTPVNLPGQREPFRLTYIEDITSSRRRRELLEWQATHDELTALLNRRLFLRMAKAQLEESRDHTMLVLDLDRFKVVNDSLGHGVGDQLLITCADRIRLSLRPGDLVCRLGGDEFAILLTSPADMGTASAVAERLLSLLREPARIADVEVFPSASIGIAAPGPDDDVDDLLRHADAAMYQSKAHGRDRWTGFDVSMRDAVLDRIRTETDLRLAIDNGQLEVHYQPEVLLSSGVIVGAEALVRWRHPEWGLLTAGSFIGVAEESGIVVDLGRSVLGVATKQAAEWISKGYDIIIRVNLSARQVRAAVVGEVEEALRAAGLAPDRLCLELTETAIMDDIEESEMILARLHELGVKLAIDDFGTGFSSLAYLKRLPVDILKIDRSFVDGVGVDPDDTSIVESVIGLANTLNLEVVAEGIEDATQVRELLRLGCARGQGFHLARPAPAEDVELLLERSRLL